jgi:hypothetical protein
MRCPDWPGADYVNVRVPSARPRPKENLMAKQGDPRGWLATVLVVGALLHRAHDAIDGYEWLADVCWCRLGRGQNG